MITQGHERYADQIETGIVKQIKFEAFTKLGNTKVSATVFCDLLEDDGGNVFVMTQDATIVVWVGGAKFSTSLGIPRGLPEQEAMQAVPRKLGELLTKMHSEV